MPEFSHRRPSHKPMTTPGKAEPEPVFADWQPPYPADGSHPGWKPVTRPATLTPTPAFSGPDRADPPVSTPPPTLKPTPQFSGRQDGDAPRSTPPARLEREPVFSAGGWRRGGQPPTRQPAGGAARRHGRPGSSDWPSVAVYRTQPATAHPQRPRSGGASQTRGRAGTLDGRQPPGRPSREPTSTSTHPPTPTMRRATTPRGIRKTTTDDAGDEWFQAVPDESGDDDV